MSARSRLRQLGQLDLGAHIEVADGVQLWSVQKRIAAAASQYRARVTVPSCTASGKSYLVGRLALSFYDAFTPGEQCVFCDGPCAGAKVITLAPKFEHLRDVLWGEMRTAYALRTDKKLGPVGKMSQGQNLRLQSAPGHWAVGQSPNNAEGLQGVHGGHILVIGDEATALDENVTKGLTSTLATGDARLLLIANPTTDDTWFAEQSRSPMATNIKITAWDTPNFTGEANIPGLLTPDFLEELKATGRGPGTFDWTTKVEADFWTQGEDVLITPEAFDKATMSPHIEGTRALGIDLAPYGSDENVIAYRDGNALVKLEAFPAMRPDLFFEGPVADAVRRFAPDYMIWDADGVGSGVYGDTERVAQRYNAAGGNIVLLPFRGGVRVDAKFTNARAAWWWALRRRFEMGTIALTLPRDTKLREQITDVRYSITDAGDIKVETKEKMKKRGTESPDRGDAVMYAFSMVDELPTPSIVTSQPLVEHAGVKDRSVEAMWQRDMEKIRRPRARTESTPWDRVPRGAQAWDDL